MYSEFPLPPPGEGFKKKLLDFHFKMSVGKEKLKMPCKGKIF